MKKKAQAAIEFLTTYGWALLVIAIVLVALGWLGVFTPQNIIQEHCQFPVGTLDCNDVLLYPVNEQHQSLRAGIFGITNNFGRDIYVCGTIISQEPPNPNLGFPTWANKGTGTHVYDLTYTKACAAGASRVGRLVKSGEQNDLADPYSLWPCINKQGYTKFDVSVGDRYSGKVYVFYSYGGETTGNARVIAGDLITKVQPAQG